MSKKPPDEPEFVKLQIPVSKELANQLAIHAKKLEYTQARVCKVMLRWALADRNRIAKWLGIRTTGKRPKGIRAGWLQLSNNSAVRLQVPVPTETAKRLEEVAIRLNHTSVRMAALLLDFSLADDELLLSLLESAPVKYITSKFGRPKEQYESAEIDEDES